MSATQPAAVDPKIPRIASTTRLTLISATLVCTSVPNLLRNVLCIHWSRDVRNHQSAVHDGIWPRSKKRHVMAISYFQRWEIGIPWRLPAKGMISVPV
jgi:hypothetical protein